MINEITKACERLGYKTPNELDVFLFGIRNPTRKAGKFDDKLGIIYKKQIIVVKGTTDPSLWKPSKHPKGTFILAPNQYIGCWMKRNHNGKYPAICQKWGYKGFKGWRDKDQGDLSIIGEPTYNDVSGLNFHGTATGRKNTNINGYSEACQVPMLWDDFIKIRDTAYSSGLTEFSYTLFDEAQLMA